MLRLALLLLFMLPALAVAEVRAVNLGEKNSWSAYPLTSHMDYAIDKEGTWTAESIARQPPLFNEMKGTAVDFPSAHPYWLRLTLINPTHRSIPMFTNHLSPYTDSLELYEASEAGVRFLGARGDRRIDHQDIYRLPLFELNVEPGTHNYLFRLETSAAINMNFQLHSKDAFYTKKFVPEYLLLGLLFGFVMVMICYNLFLAVRLRNKTFGYYVLYISMFTTIQFLITGIASHFLPAQPWKPFVLNKGLIISAELCAMFGCLFATSFLELDKTSPAIHRLVRMFYPVSILNIAICLVAHDLAASLVGLTNGFASIILLIAGFRCAWTGYRPAYFYCTAWVFMLIGNMLTMGQLYGFLASNPLTTWSQFVGGAMEVVLLSLALGDKISLAQENAQSRNLQLHEALTQHIESVEATVEEKTSDIRSIMEHIPIGIFMIHSDETIHRDYSRSLEAIYEREKIQGEKALEFLFEGSDLTTDEKSQARSCFVATLGEDAINFEANSHLLPRRMSRKDIDGNVRVFDFTWNVIEKRDLSGDKILVTVRDVTAMVQLEERDSARQHNLEMIGEILAVPGPSFSRFVKFAKSLSVENESLAAFATETRSLETIRKIYMNIHTIKGSARGHYLRHMTSRLHRVEQEFCLLLTQDDWSGSELNRQVAEASDAVRSYEEVAQVQLGRRLTHDRIEIDLAGAEDFYLKLLNAAATTPSLHELCERLRERLFRSTEDVFAEILAILPRLSKELERSVPSVKLDTDHLLLSQAGDQLFQKIFVHLLRNSLDHGLESPAERILLGKTSAGIISIQMMKRDDRVFIYYRDDGRGLATRRISEIAGITPTRFAEITECLLGKGISTSSIVSEISGRGIGMSAINNFIERAGGTIQIQNLEAFQPDKEFHAFELVFDLPFAGLFEDSSPLALIGAS